MASVRPFKLFERPKIGAERYPWDEKWEPEVPSFPEESWRNAPQPPSEIGTDAQVPPKPETALDRYQRTVQQVPKLEKAKGWKGVLQTIGEVATGVMYGPEASTAIMHPKYTRQMREYGRSVELAKQDADIEAQQMELERKQRLAEAQAAADYGRANEADANIRWKNAQAGFEDAKTRNEMNRPNQPFQVPAQGAVFDPKTGKEVYRNTPPERKDTSINDNELKMLAAQGDPVAKAVIEEDRKHEIRMAQIRASNTGGPNWQTVEAAKVRALNQKQKAWTDATRRYMDAVAGRGGLEVTPEEKQKALAVWRNEVQQAENVYAQSLQSINAGAGFPTPDLKPWTVGESLPPGVAGAPGGSPAPSVPAPKPGAPAPVAPVAGGKKQYRVRDLKTGQAREYLLDDEEAQDAVRQGYDVKALQ